MTILGLGPPRGTKRISWFNALSEKPWSTTSGQRTMTGSYRFSLMSLGSGSRRATCWMRKFLHPDRFFRFRFPIGSLSLLTVHFSVNRPPRLLTHTTSDALKSQQQKDRSLHGRHTTTHLLHHTLLTTLNAQTLLTHTHTTPQRTFRARNVKVMKSEHTVVNGKCNCASPKEAKMLRHHPFGNRAGTNREQIFPVPLQEGVWKTKSGARKLWMPTRSGRGEEECILGRKKVERSEDEERGWREGEGKERRRGRRQWTVGQLGGVECEGGWGSQRHRLPCFASSVSHSRITEPRKSILSNFPPADLLLLKPFSVGSNVRHKSRNIWTVPPKSSCA